jgi:predicted PurR-regulated permease PerM
MFAMQTRRVHGLFRCGICGGDGRYEEGYRDNPYALWNVDRRTNYALLLAMLAFPLEFIPLIGPLVAGAIIVGVCEFNDYPHIGMVLAFLVIYRIFQDYVLSPHLMKRSIKQHPLVIIFGVFAGGEIGGLGGIF